MERQLSRRGFNSGLRKIAVASVTAALIASSPIGSPSASADNHDVFTVYVNAAGADTNSGLVPDDAVASLAAAQEVLREARPQSDIEVRIAQGTYLAPTTRWDYYVPGHSVSFMPADYEIGDTIPDIDQRPIFRGIGAEGGGKGFWLAAGLPAGDEGGDTNYRFYYLEVQRYERGGLLLSGGVVPDADNILRPSNAGANGNTVRGMIFREIGTSWVQGDSATGYDGVGLSNSSNNLIEQNQFINLENFDDDYSGASSTGGNHMHGVYLTNHSSNNVVRFNNFQTISGDPIKVKNDSNNNEMYQNTARDSGTVAFVHDWFCDFTTNCANKQPQECASHGNEVHSNRIISSYGRGEISDSALLIPGDDYAGGPGCEHETQSRFIVDSNTNTTAENPAPLRINERELPPASHGVVYRYQLGARGGTGPYTWSATELPTGMNLDISSGIISGTPVITKDAVVPVGITLTDAAGDSATLKLQLLTTAVTTSVDTRSTAFGRWPDGRDVAYVVSHSGPLTLSVIDAELGDLIHAEVLVHAVGAKSYSSFVGADGEVYITTDRAGLFVFVPETGELQHVPLVSGDASIAMVDGGDTVHGVTSKGVLFGYDYSKPEESRVREIGLITASSPSASAVAVGESVAYVGTSRGGARLFAVDKDDGQSTEIALPEAVADDSKIQDLAYRDGTLFVFTSPSRELLTFDTRSEEWGESMSLMGGSRVSSSTHEDSVFLVSDETKRVVSYSLRSGEFSQSTMPANTLSYSRAYGIEVISSDLPAPYSGATIVGVASNSALWQFNLASGAFRFLPASARSGPPVPIPLHLEPSWSRFDEHHIPVGAELKPGIEGVAYSATLSAAGGTAPYTWELVDSGADTSFILSADGTLSHKSPNAGRTHLKVRVADAVGNVADANVIVNIGGATVEESACDVDIRRDREGVLDVRAGQIVCATKVVLDGPVSVGAGGKLVLHDVSLKGPLRSASAADLHITDSTLEGPVEISATQVRVELRGNAIFGTLRLVGNESAVPVFTSNRVSGPLACSDNSPALIDQLIATEVKGPRQGQCAT